MTNSVKFYLTDAGRQKAVQAEQMQLNVQFKGLVFGTGKYDASTQASAMTVLKQPIADNLGVMPFQASHVSDDGVLNVQSLIDSDKYMEVFEIGVVDNDDVLFAVASTSDEPFFAFLRNSSLVFFMAITFADISIEQISINLSAEKSLALNLLNQVERMKYRVGDIYETTIDFPNGEAVAKRHGYGVWERFAQGRVTVGLSTQDDSPEWTKTMKGTSGEYHHELSIDEMPEHRHEFIGDDSIQNNADFPLVRGSATSDVSQKGASGESRVYLTGKTGKSQPHNIVQPSITVGKWIRVA